VNNTNAESRSEEDGIMTNSVGERDSRTRIRHAVGSVKRQLSRRSWGFE
jgi:hypothetical protein